MNFAELTKRIKLSPSRKTEYFLKYKSFIDKEKLFLEEMIRIAYNLGRNDVIQEDIENHKRLFPEVENNLTGLKSTKGKTNGTDKPKRSKIRN